MGPFQRLDPALRSLIEAGDVIGTQARLRTCYGQDPCSWWRPAFALRTTVQAVWGRGTLRRTCQRACEHVLLRQDLPMLKVITPFLAPRKTVPGTWGARTPLEVAAGAGFLAGVEHLLPISDPTQGLALTWAAKKGHRTVVQRLLQPDVRDRAAPLAQRVNAIRQAAQQGHVEVLNDLLEITPAHDLTIHAYDLLTASLPHGHLTCLERLLERLAPKSLPVCRITGDTPLLLAAQFGQNACLLRLLDVPGSDPTARNNVGQTLLMLAAQQNDVATLRTVLNVSDPAVEARRTNHRGRTALMLAAGAYNRTIAVLQALQPYSDTTQRDSNGRTAFGLAWDTLDELTDPWGLNDPPEDLWARLDLLAFTEPDDVLVADVFQRGGAQRMPRWAAHLERQALHANLAAAVHATSNGEASIMPPPDHPPVRRRL